MNKKDLEFLTKEFDIKHSLSKEARSYLFDLARVSRNSIVEIGSNYGSSIIYLAHGAKKDTKIYSIDNRKKEKFGSIFPYFSNLKCLKCENIISINCLDFECVDFFSCPIGPLFIDIPDISIKSFEFWYGLVIDHGLICIRDWPKPIVDGNINYLLKKNNFKFLSSFINRLKIKGCKKEMFCFIKQGK